MTKKIPSWAELNRDNGPIVVAKKTNKDEVYETSWQTAANATKKFNDAVSEWQMAKVKMSAAWIKVVEAEVEKSWSDNMLSEAYLAKSAVKAG